MFDAGEHLVSWTFCKLLNARNTIFLELHFFYEFIFSILVKYVRLNDCVCVYVCASFWAFA